MVFHRFDRQIFVATETTEGTAQTIAATDFVETLEDVSYSLTPFSLERPLVRPSYTTIPDYFASTGITSGDVVVTRVEMTFTVELSATTGGPTTAIPVYGRLFRACGMGRINSVKSDVIAGGTITGGPIFHLEKDTSGSTQFVSTHFTGDTRVFYTGATLGTAFEGEVSGATGAIATPAGTVAGVAYAPSIASTSGNNTSCTIELNIDGRRITAKGCRGNVVFNFTAMDRVLMTFTMTGILSQIDNSANRTGISYGHQLPPTFTNAGMYLMEADGSTNFTDALFQQLTIDMGNSITLREDANSGSGWKAATITGRAPTVSFNPDAIAGGTTSSSVYDFFQKWVTGDPTRMSFTVGTLLGGNAFTFKMPALQWSGIADGDRDTYTIYDCSAKMTGGLLGDSIVNDGTGDTQYYDNKGADNDIVVIMS